MELCLYRLTDLETVFDWRHLQLTFKHVLPIHALQPRVLLYRLRVSLKSESLLRVLAEKLLDEVSKNLRSVLGEPNHTRSYKVVELSLRVSVKRWKTSIQLVKYNTKLVPICHPVMPLLVDDLKREISRSTAKRSVDIIEVVSLLTESEVSDQCMAILVKHYVLRLKVAIKNVVLVQCLDA